MIEPPAKMKKNSATLPTADSVRPAAISAIIQDTTTVTNTATRKIRTASLTSPTQYHTDRPYVFSA